MMENGFYADTLRLWQHSVEIREQKQAAQHLYELLHRACEIAAPEDVPCYRELMERSDQLIHYFSAMSNTVANMSTELEQLSLQIGSMLREN